MEDSDREHGLRTWLSFIEREERSLASSQRLLAMYLPQQARELLTALVDKSSCIDKPWSICGGVECHSVDLANELVGLGLARREWEDHPELIVATLRGMCVAEELKAFEADSQKLAQELGAKPKGGAE